MTSLKNNERLSLSHSAPQLCHQLAHMASNETSLLPHAAWADFWVQGVDSSSVKQILTQQQ